jgi:NAD(P)-dependent dehydrogenase (short-subunit alcohol dehydrogenase family)
MKEFRDRVAVVTGAASGIGRGLADRFASEEMKVVLADVEEPALAEAERELSQAGAKVLALRTDVSKAEEVEALAARAFETFGAVHIVCNNAGVSAPGGPSWERTLADWQWVLGVNLWGVIQGIRSFLPRMIEGGEEGHIVNTASMAGLVSIPGLSIYNVTKHAVVTLSESVYLELQTTGAKIGVSVLCPGFVDTNISESRRNRPPELANEGGDPPLSPQQEQMHGIVQQMLKAGLKPTAVADKVFEAIRDEKFYVLTHPEMKDGIRRRMERILQEENPVFSGMA